MNKKLITTTFGFFLTVLIFGQNNRNIKLIELAKAYKDFMAFNEPSKETVTDIYQNMPDNLKPTADFIVQTITTNNNILSKSFLTSPDTQSIKNIYIVRAINYNLREEQKIDNDKLIDSLSQKPILYYELINAYYGMLFGAVVNKNAPFDLSKTDFKLKEYNLVNETEKAIFTLNCIEFCGKQIWGYMNIKPANTKKALSVINKFPKFNGQPYYQYNDLFFPDFELILFKNKGIQSYEGYYINKYYEVLLSHLMCLNKEKGSEKDKKSLLLGSILKENSLYKYTQYKGVLENIFKVQSENDIKEDIKEDIKDPVEYIKKETIGGKLDFNKILENEKQQLILFEGVAYNKKDFAIFLWSKKVKLLGIETSTKAQKIWEDINNRVLTEPEHKALIKGFESK
jgi:hypothetical protein